MTWALFLELLIRSTLILVAGEILRRLYRNRSSASFRHRLLLWTFALLASLPVLSALLPEIHIPLGHLNKETASVTVQQTTIAVLPQGAQHGPDWLMLLWLTGVLVSLVPTIAGVASASGLVKRAHRARINNPDLDRSLREVSPFSADRPEILLSRDLLVPLTCGLLRRRILLPVSAAGWTQDRLRAVLLHELAHVRRRDVLAQISVQIVSALWWFQPLVWLLRRALRNECELACDAEALRSNLRPSEYAAELLALAKGIGPERSFASAGISMTRSSDLEIRVRAILDPPSSFFPRPAAWAVAFALGGVAAGSSTFTTTAKPVITQQKGSSMKHSVFSALLTSAGLSAATISGSLFDPSGAAIPDAKVLLYNPDTGAKQEATSGPEGKFALDDASGGQYILRVEKPGFDTILREFDVKPDAKIDRKLTMEVGHLEQEVHVADRGAPRAASDNSSPQRVRIGGRVAQANLISKIQPVYPGTAKAAGIQGTVELEATISKEGVPLELRVVRSPSDDLSQASLEAVRQWRYRATLLNGNPVEVVTTVICNYTLSQ